MHRVGLGILSVAPLIALSSRQAAAHRAYPPNC